MTLMERVDAPEDRLAQLGIELPDLAPVPIGAFCNVRRSGHLVFVSGQGPVTSDGRLLTGKVGADVTSEAAREHAKLVAINILAALRDNLGDLNGVAGVIKLLGLVNATSDFANHPYVIDGASNLFAEVFGKDGVHARSSFGVSSLPNQITVEIEAIFEVPQ
ncbi:MAG: RidA family protein [Pseudomonadota bacterium]